jgi:hypothetical protein
MSDTTDLSIILLLLLSLTVYVLYVRKLINATYNISNTKCNPVNLFLKSIDAESSEGIDNFAECIQLLNPNSTNPAATLKSGTTGATGR